MSKDHILIVATHDRSVAEHCDRVLYVRNGKLEEISHKDLQEIDEAALLNEAELSGSLNATTKEGEEA